MTTPSAGSGSPRPPRASARCCWKATGWPCSRTPFPAWRASRDLGVEIGGQVRAVPVPQTQHPLSLRSARARAWTSAQWEAWLDRYTGTRQEDGSLDLLIDGERFFPRLQQAIAAATNHIHFDVYIFDKDDVGVSVADQLKERSRQVEVKVIFDRLGSIGGGRGPPGTPMPEDFVAPTSIYSYLKQDSNVRVRPFLNPWFSSDHSKVFLVDGTHAWMGGMNLGREYRYEWHDLMVELQGPVVASLEDEFRRDWAHEGLLGDLGYLAELARGPREKQAPRGPGIAGSSCGCCPPRPPGSPSAPRCRAPSASRRATSTWRTPTSSTSG